MGRSDVKKSQWFTRCTTQSEASLLFTSHLRSAHVIHVSLIVANDIVRLWELQFSLQISVQLKWRGAAEIGPFALQESHSSLDDRCVLPVRDALQENKNNEFITDKTEFGLS